MQLALDQFGNYAVQELLLASGPEQRNQMLGLLLSKVELLLSDKYGNRVICGLLENEVFKASLKSH